ncbi:glycosyltransferase family 2 protein [Pseudothioclava arenosa]|nr:glycosyltransferase family 2 protein [Pseudothioclava arenosa]
MIAPDDILLFACMRNEAHRLPQFLDHYRHLGIAHFLIVENDSTDDTAAFLAGQPDVSLWRSTRSYRAARFGMDWVNWLLWRHGSGHWCLTVDADELLVYPESDTRGLPELTRWLDARGQPSMRALMLDLYPKGPVSGAAYQPGQDPTEVLNWFDAEGYRHEAQPKFETVSIRGGPRARTFFAQTPSDAPHLNKVPLVRWHWRYAYLSSTHMALPIALNGGTEPNPQMPTGALLHTKFLDGIIARSKEEKRRREHFTHAARFDRYYDAIIADPDLWTPESRPYDGPAALESAGLMQRGLWP